MSAFDGCRNLDLLAATGAVTRPRRRRRRTDWQFFWRHAPLLPMALAAGMLTGAALAVAQ